MSNPRDYTAEMVAAHAAAQAARDAQTKFIRYRKVPRRAGICTYKLLYTPHIVNHVDVEYEKLVQGSDLSIFGGPDKVPPTGTEILILGRPVLRSAVQAGDSWMFRNSLGWKKDEDGKPICPLRQEKKKLELRFVANVLVTDPDRLDGGIYQWDMKSEWFGRKVPPKWQVACHGLSHLYAGYTPSTPDLLKEEEAAAAREVALEGGSSVAPQVETTLDACPKWGSKIVQEVRRGAPQARDVALIFREEVFFQKKDGTGGRKGLALDLSYEGGPVRVVSEEGSLGFTDELVDRILNAKETNWRLEDLLTAPRWQPGFSSNGDHFWPFIYDLMEIRGERVSDRPSGKAQVQGVTLETGTPSETGVKDGPDSPLGLGDKVVFSTEKDGQVVTYFGRFRGASDTEGKSLIGLKGDEQKSEQAAADVEGLLAKSVAPEDPQTAVAKVATASLERDE
jgi:hypothetical protein